MKGTPKVKIGFDKNKDDILFLNWTVHMRDSHDPHGKFDSRFELIKHDGKPILVITNGRTDNLRKVYTGFNKETSIKILQALLKHNGQFDSYTHYKFPPTDEGGQLISLAITPPISQTQNIEPEIVEQMLAYLTKEDSTESTQNRVDTANFTSHRTI